MKKYLRYFGVALVAIFLLAGSVTIHNSDAMLANRMLMGAAGSGEVDWYGVTWDEDNSSPTLTRTGNTSGEAAAAALSNANAPVQALMKRCILSDAGVVQYYLCATDSTDKENCSTASNLDGTDGQVMVEIPLFWYLYEYDSDTNVHSWSISLEDQGGDWERHPAFYKDGSWVDHRYIGAYEGIKYDDGTSSYVDGVSAGIDTANDILSSVSGFAPWTNDTRAEVRAVASNRGAGWRQQDFYLMSAIQLLYVVEYASWYSQDVIGMGRTELTGGTWVKDNYVGVTGKSNSDGNATANTGGDTNDAYMSYRGIENLYGNVWGWVDGFNINGNIPYVCNDESLPYADDTATGYTRLTDTGESGITLVASDGYQTTLEQTKGGFLPSAVGGSSSTYITDYYYQSPGWAVAMLGGCADSGGAAAGAFYWALGSAFSGGRVDIGSRLSY